MTAEFHSLKVVVPPNVFLCLQGSRSDGYQGEKGDKVRLVCCRAEAAASVCHPSPSHIARFSGQWVCLHVFLTRCACKDLSVGGLTTCNCARPTSVLHPSSPPPSAHCLIDMPALTSLLCMIKKDHLVGHKQTSLSPDILFCLNQPVKL